MSVSRLKKLMQPLIVVGVVVYVFIALLVCQSMSQGGVFHSSLLYDFNLSATKLKDIFISVKTSEKFHKSRLSVIIKTWFQLAKDQTWFFTDSDDKDMQDETNGHMVNTNCPPSHNRTDLLCKMSVEFDTFIKSGKRWFCHVDDDNYVNIPRLVLLLNNYCFRKDWYLGKTSIKDPVNIRGRGRNPRNITFYFGTGGAGFCLSQALALKMDPMIGGGKFVNISGKINMADDVAMGYVVEYLLKKQLTVIEQFHSHIESLKSIRKIDLHKQITLSYKGSYNLVQINGFNKQKDPTRFLSIHCFLFPKSYYCPR